MGSGDANFVNKPNVVLEYWVATTHIATMSQYICGCNNSLRYNYKKLVCNGGPCGGSGSFEGSSYLRPIVYLKPNLTFSGSGTSGSPYTIVGEL